MPPLGKMPINVQDANVDVNLHDVLLDVTVHSKVPFFDVVLLPDDVGVALAIFVVVLLADDVDKVDGQNDADVLNFLPQFLMCKVMPKSACVIFPRMLCTLAKLSCMLSMMMSMFMFMLNSLAMLWFMVLMHILYCCHVRCDMNFRDVLPQ